MKNYIWNRKVMVVGFGISVSLPSFGKNKFELFYLQWFSWSLSNLDTFLKINHKTGNVQNKKDARP
jgi:hypothetical protein